MQHESFKSRIIFILCCAGGAAAPVGDPNSIIPLQYRGPLFLTGKYKHSFNQMRVITTSMAILRKQNEIQLI